MRMRIMQINDAIDYITLILRDPTFTKAKEEERRADLARRIMDASTNPTSSNKPESLIANTKKYVL